jgi:hypothetical protein
VIAVQSTHNGIPIGLSGAQLGFAWAAFVDPNLYSGLTGKAAAGANDIFFQNVAANAQASIAQAASTRMSYALIGIGGALALGGLLYFLVK